MLISCTSSERHLIVSPSIALGSRQVTHGVPCPPPIVASGGKGSTGMNAGSAKAKANLVRKRIGLFRDRQPSPGTLTMLFALLEPLSVGQTIHEV